VLLTIPVDEGALSDLEPLGNPGQAPAFSPKFEELVFGFNVMHHGARFRLPFVLRVGAPESVALAP